MELQKSTFRNAGSGTKKKEISENVCSVSARAGPVASGGPKFPLLREGDILVCRLNHQRTFISKVLGSRILRRWETHRLVLSDTQIYSTTPNGYMDFSLSYYDIHDVRSMPRWDTSQRFTIQIVIPHGSLLLQANNAYLRDQWLHSLEWRINSNKYKHLFAKLKNPEELLRELQELIKFSLVIPLHDDVVFQLPLNTVSNLLLHHAYKISDPIREALLQAAGPLLEVHNPTPAICKCFQKICKNRIFNQEVLDVFIPSVQRILKHNTDFGKLPYLRTLVQDFICVLHHHNEIDAFIASIHTAGTTCPHPRVLPNLIAVCLAAFYSVYDEKTEMSSEEQSTLITCFQQVLKEILKYPDWLPGLSTLLQAVPFPKKALEDNNFSIALTDVVKVFAADRRCEVHQNIFPIREGKHGWINHFAPDGLCCIDDAEVFADIMSSLMKCCGKRKKTLMVVEQSLRSAFVLMAIRGDESCIQALVLMLDFEVVEDENEKQQIITALQTTETGRVQYENLCLKKAKFREMRLQNGPKQLTLPTKSTDNDLAAVLNSGPFGNLETLNLAFTKVTGACAEHLIQLPALLHLNLWSTQFDDRGLHTIAEHINTLQSLNLCETSVTDDGLSSLPLMQNLKFLNLNSTKLSALAFERLKNEMGRLEQVDIRYTEAW